MAKRGKFFLAPASYTRRILAFIIDIILFDLIILFPFNRLFQKAVPAGNILQQLTFLQNNPHILRSFYPLLITANILLIFYFSYFEYKLQQTPGKMLLRIQVVPQNSPTFWNYLFSNLTFLTIFPFTLLWIIDPMHMIFSPKNQRFMEKINKLIVIQKYKY
jgi:uncharacterized RDD family membrane protein YckC